MYQWLVFLHILGAFVFFIAHGASIVMAFQLRRIGSSERVKTLLEFSNAALPAAYMGLMAVILAGIAAGIMGNWFSFGWIWASIALMVVLWFGMHAYAGKVYAPIRRAVGLPYRDRQGEHPAEPPASEAEIAQLLQSGNPLALCGTFFGLVAVILWLMVFKPF